MFSVFLKVGNPADFYAVPPPAIVNFNPKGGFQVVPLNATSCPETHFRCAGGARGYCLPVYLRCNGANDCPGREDEAGCDGGYQCPGFYRCRSSTVCLHPSDLCDAVPHCPQRDDETLCSAHCPPGCTCYGWSFFCVVSLQASNFSQLRFLDASGSGLVPADVAENALMVHLSLARCGLRDVSFPTLHNLRSLDLSDNGLVRLSLHLFEQLPQLRALALAGNPMAASLLLPRSVTSGVSASLLSLDLSRVAMDQFDPKALAPFPDLQALNLSHSGVERVLHEALPTKLRVLDVRGCPVKTFPRTLLRNLTKLAAVFADNYKLCCRATLPGGFNLNDCKSPDDDISSCEQLLGSGIYRALVAGFAIMATLGNLSVFVFFTLAGKLSEGGGGFSVFVVHLCVSDFVMGVYLAVIGVADRLYQGTYLWEDVAWRHSAACRAAGFLSLLSSEVSALVIFLITLDRFLVLRFPFSAVRFGRRSAGVTCGALWALGLGLAALPLLPALAHWRLYSRSAICSPLPLSGSSAQVARPCTPSARHR